MKYRIVEHLEALSDPRKAEWIKALICWRLRIWHTTLYRKIYAKVGDHRSDRKFTFQEMQVVWSVFDEILGTEWSLSIYDLYQTEG